MKKKLVSLVCWLILIAALVKLALVVDLFVLQESSPEAFRPNLAVETKTNPCEKITNGFTVEYDRHLFSLSTQPPFNTGIQNFPSQGMLQLVVEGKPQASMVLKPDQYGQMWGETENGQAVFAGIHHCGSSFAVEGFIDENHTKHELLLKYALEGRTKWEDVDRLFKNNISPTMDQCPIIYLISWDQANEKIVWSAVRTVTELNGEFLSPNSDEASTWKLIQKIEKQVGQTHFLILVVEPYQ